MFPGWPPMGVPPIPPGQPPPTTPQGPSPGAAASAAASTLPPQGSDIKEIFVPFHFVPSFVLHDYNRPRSIYQYSNMAPRLSGQTSIFGVVLN